jgi:hypothetical protein
MLPRLRSGENPTVRGNVPVNGATADRSVSTNSGSLPSDMVRPSPVADSPARAREWRLGQVT